MIADGFAAIFTAPRYNLIVEHRNSRDKALTDALTAALIAGASAIAGGIVGGLLSGAYQHLRDHLARPRLVIDFRNEAANREEAEYKDGEKTISDIYLRARVRNDGHLVANGCRVFIASLSEVHPPGVTATSLHDAKQLAWAGYKFSALDIPPGVDFYVNILRVSKHDPGWLFSVERLFASQQELKNYRGTYRFRLLATAANADPASCEIDVSYDGDWHSLRALPSSPGT